MKNIDPGQNKGSLKNNFTFERILRTETNVQRERGGTIGGTAPGKIMRGTFP